MMTELSEELKQMLLRKEYAEVEEICSSALDSSEPDSVRLEYYIRAVLANKQWRKAIYAWEKLCTHNVEESLSIGLLRAFICAPDAVTDMSLFSHLFEHEDFSFILVELMLFNRPHFTGVVKPILADKLYGFINTNPLTKNLCPSVAILGIEALKDEVKSFLSQNIMLYSFEEICTFHDAIKKFYGYDVLYECLDIERLHSSENVFTFLILNEIQQQKLTTAQALFLLQKINQDLKKSDATLPPSKDIFLFDKAKAASFFIVNKHLAEFNYNKNCMRNAMPSKKTKPRVALCISGQLRGYQQAFETLKNTIIKDLSPDVFVHTWRNIGGYREPILSHAQRVFPSAFSEAYKNILMTCDMSIMQRKYPTLFAKLNDPTQATTDELRLFFGTEHVVVEDDTQAQFASFNNFQKMYYKIHACHELATNFANYDYIIRIRPDKPLAYAAPVDWDKVFYDADRDTAYLDDVLRLHPTVKMVVGDQFALTNAETMRIYASSWQTAAWFKEQNLPGGLPLLPHNAIAYRLLMAGKTTKTIKNLKFPPLTNLVLPAHDILKCLEIDAAQRMDADDLCLISAARSDLLAEM
ncbi:hypothetical protein DTO96_101605 [Ephemeroptericola cinctiostellae]|uniref:Uncharacterized protein n=1 Tax=Ephemeroptericola cinctiostellae TaxID=2268024 RepID=A0A345DBX7_9BURK|nr:hypothetical protein [Ephemeroptericola cinctiostellae]AXF85865.1 hypothetical protein DTO96_101605 [Ephemeroptericola cinctiostellae]